MGYSIVNSKGIKYWLHRVLAKKNKRYIYYFSKNPENSIELPENYIVIESPYSKIPMLKKKRW